MAINTTTAAVTEAMRAHHGDTRIGMPYTEGERRAVSIAVIESTRRFAIEHGHDDDDDPDDSDDGNEIAMMMRDELHDVLRCIANNVFAISFRYPQTHAKWPFF